MSGNDLYAAGSFTTAGGISAANIARWNGSRWSALGSGIGGDFAFVAALAVSGNDVYAGGWFTSAGGSAAANIARWNGSSWSALGSGLDGGGVSALAVSGTDLYAGGYFTNAGGSAANYVAKWNGNSWSALGSGLGGAPPDAIVNVRTLAVSGTDVYAGGDFTIAGGVAAFNLAKWNGNSWSALGSGISRGVRALALSGNDLYAGGNTYLLGDRSRSSIAKWTGTSWITLASGIMGDLHSGVSALAASGGDLYVGGSFSDAGGKFSPFLARAYLPDLPALSVSRSGSAVRVSWPSAGTADFALEQSGALSVLGSWIANTGTVTDDGVKKSVALPATNSARFFHLRR
jgi:hypothetical protein